MDQFTTTSSSDNELDNTSAFHLHELSKDVDESDGEDNISDDEDDKNNINHSLKNKVNSTSNNNAKSQLSSSSSSTTTLASNDVPFSRIFVICGKDVTENQLAVAFQPFGTTEIKIVVDKDTRESKGYAYIKYQKASSAALAIEKMNGTILSISNNNGTNSTTTSTTSTTTTTNNNNTTTTTDDKSPTAAGVPLKVMIAEVKGQKSKVPPSTDPEDSPPNSRLFVICKKDVSEADLTNRFKEFGNLEHVKIVRERDTHESKGYAFVKFSKSSTAALAMETINESDDKSLKIIIALPKGKTNNTKPEATATPLAQPFPMIGNPYQFQNEFPNPYFPTISRQRLFVVCHKSVTQENLYKLFSRYPGMEYCDLKKDKTTNKSKGFAYVNYSTPQAALLAKNELNGIKYPSGYSLKVVFAEPLGIKQAPQSIDPTISSIQNSFAQMPFTRRNSNNDNRKRQKI
ncbi:hypothetical protein DFA_00660 [Cavenderia fasciculata]|uniref:RRM domain-containing protein n=1 Tax=Cavenderia fasciculata TaxID=261658 RepID=F4PT59_CACFS|nr:uncharacterized protein DFA_00660 [Cavenderia fasciculata]EGG20795.1 hypothetical protein DFA_00660 [Cavenderia fasciculata]|eukprot:XP_004358645.1 hypothetical protein DFA_00660 [Cavenderia fasciculata]